MTNKNPPAFPVVGPGIDEPWRGMNLRDYFAAAAMQGIIAHHGNENFTGDDADDAYEIADTMLVARE